LAFHVIITGDGDVVLPGVFCAEALDDGVCGLADLGIENLDTAGFGRLVLLFTASVEYGDNTHISGVLVLSEAADKFIAGGATTPSVDGTKLRPLENDAVAVNDKVTHEKARDERVPTPSNLLRCDGSFSPFFLLYRALANLWLGSRGRGGFRLLALAMDVAETAALLFDFIVLFTHGW
jgi:hypothetical protein